MELPLLLQFSIALFTGMVAATFVPPVRRAIPKQLELALWIGLVTVCTLGIVGIADPRTRELTSSAAWGVDQIVNTSAGLIVGGVVGWISDNHFAIATWLALLAGLTLLVLALMRSRRKAQAWQPRVWLGEWMEMPSHQILAAQPAARRQPTAEFNRGPAASTAATPAQLLKSLRGVGTRMRQAVFTQGAQHLAHATEVGRAESRATAESIREATSHLQFAAKAWYTAAGAPMVKGAGTKATRAARRAASAGKRSAKRSGVIDIQALVNAQSIGWYGPMSAGAPLLPPASEQDVPESQRSDRMAS